MLNPIYRITYLNKYILIVLLFSFFLTPSLIFATSISRMSVVNIEGYPGKTITEVIRLEGSDSIERSGYWYTYYKKMDGDNYKMDITSWISISPEEYNIKEGEKIDFTIKIKIPKDTKPGLWGATSKDAGKEGYSKDRRTYIVFKDAPIDGNVYSGLLIPISVEVLTNTNPLTRIIYFLQKNILTIFLIIIIILMGFFLFKKNKNYI